jgi:hypothetical protein
MVFRRFYAVVALTALVATSGCFHRCCCWRRPCAPTSCGCEATSGYPPVVMAPTAAPPLVKGPPMFESR